MTLFEIASQRSTSQADWMTLALISNIANYLKYNYFLHCDGIDNVTLRLWKFSDFCSRHTVGVAGDDITFHILVLSVYVCHDDCPDDLTMKDWCHKNNMLHVYYWGCLVVQVMFHVLLTSLMTSPGHKIGQILKLLFLRQYLSYSVDQILKMLEMLLAIFLVYQLPVPLRVKSLSRAQIGSYFENFAILNTASIWPQIFKDHPKSCKKKYFSLWWRHRWRHRVTSKSTLFIAL